MRRGAWVTALLLGLSWAAAHALAFRSIKESGALMYDAPALSARKLFVVSRHYPVEELSQYKNWTRVRDATGGIAWVPQNMLSRERWLLVTADEAKVCDEPNGAVRFRVPRDGVLALVEPPRNGWISHGWVKVRHRDGGEGYVRIGELWGL